MEDKRTILGRTEGRSLRLCPSARGIRQLFRAINRVRQLDGNGMQQHPAGTELQRRLTTTIVLFVPKDGPPEHTTAMKPQLVLPPGLRVQRQMPKRQTTRTLRSCRLPPSCHGCPVPAWRIDHTPCIPVVRAPIYCYSMLSGGPASPDVSPVRCVQKIFHARSCQIRARPDPRRPDTRGPVIIGWPLHERNTITSGIIIRWSLHNQVT
jgi:hypothetical protein